jgi:hypothetical protein
MPQERQRQYTRTMLSALRLAATLVLPVAGFCTMSQNRSDPVALAQEVSKKAPSIDLSMSIMEARQLLTSLILHREGIVVDDIQISGHDYAWKVHTKDRRWQMSGTFKDTPWIALPTELGTEWCFEILKTGSLDGERICLTSQDEAERFVKAMNRLIWEDSPRGRAEVEAEQAEFRRKLDAWRAGGSKIEPPEEARQHYVLAQEAFREKDVQHQADELSAALKIYPTWPSAQSDLALLLGELKHYSDAIQHMQMYLQLAPNAPDAENAKEQIWIWQDKAPHERAGP